MLSGLFLQIQRSKTPLDAQAKGLCSNHIDLSFDRQFDVDRLLFLAQSAAQLRQRNVLQLANALTGHAEFLAHFFESLGLAAIETEARENDLALAIVEDIEQAAGAKTLTILTVRLFAEERGVTSASTCRPGKTSLLLLEVSTRDSVEEW